MKPPKPYITGPITGIPDGNLPAFMDAEATLRQAGYDPINPRHNGAEGERTWREFMRIALHQIAECDGLAVLPGWETSEGAGIEVRLVTDLGLPVLDVPAWVDLAEKYDQQTIISKSTYLFTVLHRTDEPFVGDDPLHQALARSWDGHAVGQITSERTEIVPDNEVEIELLILGNDGTFFDDDLGMSHEN
jgi:Domain of unknown function (DUF4406)